ncbi:MAG: ExbD/TolR family protein [Phycisphaerales bacterium]
MVPDAPFDLTPMIDVVLLLIIFFTLTAQFAKTQMRTPMDLPDEKGESAPDPTATVASVVVDLDQDGRMAVMGNGVNIADVETLLAQARAKSPSLSVEVRAHRLATGAALNRLAAALARAGIKEWSLGTSGQGTARDGGGGGSGDSPPGRVRKRSSDCPLWR